MLWHTQLSDIKHLPPTSLYFPICKQKPITQSHSEDEKLRDMCSHLKRCLENRKHSINLIIIITTTIIFVSF